MPHFVYILKSQKDGSYYTGSTQDVADRLKRHNQGRSNYTKSKRHWDLIYVEEYPDKSSATKRERLIKNRRSRSYIEGLVRTSRQT
jgi:putative endonuclease